MEVPGSAEGTGKNSPACQEVRTLSSLEKLSRGVLFLWTLGIVWLIGGRNDTDGENRRNKWESTAVGGLQSFLLLLLRGKVTSHKVPLERLCASALMSHHRPERRPVIIRVSGLLAVWWWEWQLGWVSPSTVCYIQSSWWRVCFQYSPWHLPGLTFYSSEASE